MWNGELRRVPQTFLRAQASWGGSLGVPPQCCRQPRSPWSPQSWGSAEAPVCQRPHLQHCSRSCRCTRCSLGYETSGWTSEECILHSPHPRRLYSIQETTSLSGLVSENNFTKSPNFLPVNWPRTCFWDLCLRQGLTQPELTFHSWVCHPTSQVLELHGPLNSILVPC